MANNTTIQNQLQPRIDAFVQEISDLVRRAALSSVQEALQGNGSAPARRGPGRPRKAGKKATTRRAASSKAAAAPAKRRGRPGRRSSEDIEATGQQILEHVRANPGQRSEEIKAKLGIPAGDFERPVGKLLADGKVRTEGQRRGTKYFAGSGGGGRKAGKKASKKAGRKAGKRAGKAGKKASKKAGRKVGKKRGTKAGKRKTTKRGATAGAGQAAN